MSENKKPLCQYIRSVTLENVRTFRSKTVLDCCFPDGRLAQWTVLLGENGSGKTTLLQYIAGLLPEQGHLEIMLRPMVATQEWLGWHAANIPRPWKKEVNEVGVIAKLSMPSTDLKSARAVPEEIASGAVEGPAAEYGFTTKFLIHPENGIRANQEMTIPRSSDFALQFPLFAYGASRHVAGPSSPYVTSEHFFRNGGSSPVNTIFNDDHPLISPEQWLLGLHHLKDTKGEIGQRAGRVLKQAEACLCNVLPDVNGIRVIPFGLIGESPRMTLMFRTPFSEVPFGSLSLGYRAMAAWLVDFLRRMFDQYANLEHPNEGPAIVLIDEFDLHLHPKWQMEAMKVLGREFPNTQFIVTVHSPLTVQAADGNANLALLRRVRNKAGEESVILENEPVFAQGWRLDQIATSDLFDWPSARSATFTRLIKRRVTLLQKDALTDKEKAELTTLNERVLHEAPTGKTPATQWLEKAARRKK